MPATQGSQMLQKRALADLAHAGHEENLEVSIKVRQFFLDGAMDVHVVRTPVFGKIPISMSEFFRYGCTNISENGGKQREKKRD
jgi:hypothetical protein